MNSRIIAAAAPATAEVADFQACDGYGAPNRQGDGMTRPATSLFGLLAPQGRDGNGRAVGTPTTGKGVDSCTSALADARLRPAYHLRRASLLRARGMHRIANGEREAALADFDLADQAAAPADDIFYRRSLLLGTRLLRAYAGATPGTAGNSAGAAAALIAERPYDAQFGFAAARVELAAARDWEAYAGRLRGLARYNPNLITAAYGIALMRGRFDELVSLHRHVQPTAPANRGGYVVADREGVIAQNLVLQTEVDGAYAYALATLGRTEQARQALTAARARVEAALRDPVPPAGRDSVPGNIVRQHRANLDVRHHANEALRRWDAVVGFRLQIARGEVDQAVHSIRTEGLGADAVTLDLFRAIARARPQLAADAAAALGTIEASISSALTGLANTELAEIAERLPEAEATTRLPAYDGASDSILSVDGNGYMAGRGSVPGGRTIRFVSQRGTMAMVGEMALLRAAELARQQGKGGFIILNRRGLVRTSQNMMYNVVVREDPQGYDIELDVMFVDPQALPAGFEDAGWRVVDAQQVWNDLSPIYAAARPDGASRGPGTASR
jgi:hypothetical protein